MNKKEPFQISIMINHIICPGCKELIRGIAGTNNKILIYCPGCGRAWMITVEMKEIVR